MYIALTYLLIFISFMIIILILSQPSKQQDSLSLLSTDKSDVLFKTQKYNSHNNFLMWSTAILAVIWITLGIILMYLGEK
ncbi:preprotein translocase subunit SecG [Lactococcus lactis]|uniref:Protein-export membrane protein SecG n=1 Tax=Lactococcus lactis subsp. lactis TaxID=1360 RepID=A0A0V8DV66_LACLL|nr:MULTISPECIES: preprotein translocase subunit SecG [Lactococcus]KSU17527.1 hypothetical protein M20_2677 [Lactococcus lactis subsp. lactis]MBK0084513.1 preprotein translocase subunit SecG [Lactococcus sp. S64]MBK5077433.1 preprotein translocase subunit SecG [Lactococcus lactis]MDG4967450.1 preprotein translocase subunit SecG [Lactococcus lactis]